LLFVQREQRLERERARPDGNSSFATSIQSGRDAGARF
jgi:hypothetical protein